MQATFDNQQHEPREDCLHVGIGSPGRARLKVGDDD